MEYSLLITDDLDYYGPLCRRCGAESACHRLKCVQAYINFVLNTYTTFKRNNETN